MGSPGAIGESRRHAPSAGQSRTGKTALVRSGSKSEVRGVPAFRSLTECVARDGRSWGFRYYSDSVKRVGTLLTTINLPTASAGRPVKLTARLIQFHSVLRIRVEPGMTARTAGGQLWVGLGVENGEMDIPTGLRPKSAMLRGLAIARPDPSPLPRRGARPPGERTLQS